MQWKRFRMNLFIILAFLFISLSIFSIQLSNVPVSSSLSLLTLLSPLIGGPTGNLGTAYGYGNYGDDCYSGYCTPLEGEYGYSDYGSGLYGGTT